MQFAESWVSPRFSPRLGFGALLLVAAATGFALAPGPHQDRTTIPARVDFHRTHCSGGERIESKVETVDQTLIANHEVDPYTPVFESAELTSCFGDESRIEMLVDIAADGHVTRVTHRPERPNRASRCIAHAVRHLQFPAADSPVSIRYAFTK